MSRPTQKWISISAPSTARSPSRLQTGENLPGFGDFLLRLGYLDSHHPKNVYPPNPEAHPETLLRLTARTLHPDRPRSHRPNLKRDLWRNLQAVVLQCAARAFLP